MGSPSVQLNYPFKTMNQNETKPKALFSYLSFATAILTLILIFSFVVETPREIKASESVIRFSKSLVYLTYLSLISGIVFRLPLKTRSWFDQFFIEKLKLLF